MANNSLLVLKPVAAEVYGEGLPYAPENWPEEGDIWGWRTGRRVVPNGTHFQDRYLYLPGRLLRKLKEENSKEKARSGSGSATPRKHRIFASKLAVKGYVNKYFPDADLNAFFSSFSWKIPALSVFGNVVPIAAVPLRQIPYEACYPDGGDVANCKANNKECPSVVLKEEDKYLQVMPCDVCCSEPMFCRDCCCILCTKPVCTAYGGYSYVKCRVNAGNGICGHVAHIECALRCYLAGKFGVQIGLEAEYQCRRCDGRTDMISHVNNLLQACKATDMHDQIEKILNICSLLLRGSRKPAAKQLLRRVEMTISKAFDRFEGLHQLKLRTNLEDIWKEDDSLVVYSADNDNVAMDITMNDGHSEVKTGSECCIFLPRVLELEGEVDQALLDFRKSQELEYKVAEETLQTQKAYLQNLYQQLEYEENLLAAEASSSTSKPSSSAVRERKKQIKREVDKFEVMKKVANGFSRTSHSITKEHFGFEVID